MKRISVALLGLVLLPILLLGQDSADRYSPPACKGYWELSYQHQYLKEADSLWDVGNLDRSSKLYASATKRFKREKNWRGLIKSRNRLAENFRMNFHFDSAISILQNNLDLIDSQLGSDPVELGEVYFLLGVAYDWNRETDQSLEAHNQALQIRIQLYGEDHFDVARSYAAIGNMFWYIDQFQTAVKYLNNAVDIFSSLECENTLRGARTYYSLASAYRGLADYERANIYGVKALSLLNDKSSGDRARCNLLLGNINLQMAQFSNSIKYFNNALSELQTQEKLSTNEKMNLANLMNSIGSAHLEVQRYDSALHYHFRSLKLYQGLEAEDEISIVYQNIGINYSNQGKYDSAKVYLLQAINIRNRVFGAKHFRTSSSLRYLGDHFYRMNELDSATKYYQQAIVAGSGENFKSFQASDNPDLDDFIFDGSLLSAMWKKGATLSAIYHRDANINNLTSSLETLQIAIDLLDENQAMYELEGSSLLLSRDFYEVFEAALNACYELHRVLKDPKYLQIAFQIMEKSKARLLYDTFSGLQLSQKVGVPDSLMKKENSIKSRLASFSKDLEKEQTSFPNDAGKIARLEEEVFQSTVALERFHEHLESAYPSYATSIRSELMDITAITERLSKENKGLVSYFWGKQDLFTLSIIEGKTSIYRQPIDTVAKRLVAYQQHLVDGPHFTNQVARFQQFAKEAHRLYRVLFNDIQLTGQPLIIATDGPLRLIPFEALVVEIPNDISNDYSQLTYLLNKFPTSYIYSANLWAIQPQLEAGEMRTLGIGHSSSEDTQGPNELPGTAREIEILQSQLKGLFLSGSKATKQSFLQHAQDYNIIHLAIHGISDSISRLNNRLLFRNPDLSGETEPLYTYELYNLRLNSRLAVLSACESGTGKNFQGEGVYSMSRAFSYAGCPTTVMSLWRISDKTTPEILESFYRLISDGHPVDVALQQAKLKYLADHPQNLSHPAYWAAMVVYGSTDKLTDGESKLKLVLPMVVIGILILVFYLRRRRTIHQSG